MILKVLTNRREKFEYVLRYMLENKDRLYDAGGDPFVLTHNLKGNDVVSWTTQFKDNEKKRTRKRRKDGIVLYHEVIAFSPADTRHITTEKLEAMLREYIRLRNPNGSYVICVHRDREHIHAHVCSSAIDRNGNNMRLSRTALFELKRRLQECHVTQYPELSRSVVRHGRKGKRVSVKEVEFKQRTGKLSQRECVRRTVLSCYERADSEAEFYSLLKAEGMETYVRGGRVYGVVVGGRRYRFTNLGIGTNVINTQSLKRGIDKKRRR